MSGFEARCIHCGWAETHSSYPDAAAACREHSASCIEARTEIDDSGSYEWLTDEVVDEIEAAANTEGPVFDDVHELVDDLRSTECNDEHDLSTSEDDGTHEDTEPSCSVSDCNRVVFVRIRWVFAVGYEMTHDYCAGHTGAIVYRVVPDLPAGISAVEVIR